MGKKTSIAWVDSTWNPWWGCQKVSPGCEHCYASVLAKRAGKDCWGPTATREMMSAEYWAEPLKWDTAAAGGKVGKDGKHWIVFGGDMCDIFDSRGLNNERKRMWDLIRKTPHLTWLLLSKRPQNFHKFLPADWGNGYQNVWLGVTVDDHKHGFPRVDILRQTPAAVRFLSCEPLLEDVSDINLTGIDWVVTGGESGAGSRPFDLQWARNLKLCCEETSTAFFFKQLGSKPTVGDSPFPILNKQENGKRDAHGKAAVNFPLDLHVQEWPDHGGAVQTDADGLSLEACTQVLNWLNDFAQAPDIGVLGHLAQSAYASLTGMLQVLADVSDAPSTMWSSSGSSFTTPLVAQGRFSLSLKDEKLRRTGINS